MLSILLSRVSNEWRRIKPVLISTRLFVTANSEVIRSITAMSPVTSTPTIKKSARNLAMLPPREKSQIAAINRRIANTNTNQ